MLVNLRFLFVTLRSYCCLFYFVKLLKPFFRAQKAHFSTYPHLVCVFATKGISGIFTVEKLLLNHHKIFVMQGQGWDLFECLVALFL
jgi:hypothetical protein